MIDLEKKIKAYARRFCNKIGKTNDADDLANYLRLFEYKHRKNKSVDFFRERYGRTGTARSTAERNTEIKEIQQFNQSIEQDHSWMLWDEVKKLPRNERVMTFLHYKYGITLLELGEIYGISEGRVCQIVSSAEKTLQRRMEEEKRPEKQGTLASVLSPEQGSNTFKTSEDLL